MAPRHGTGPPDDQPSATYGTRSKRKVTDITEDEQANGRESKKTSPVASKKQKIVEPKSSPIAKRRTGRQRSVPVKFSESSQSSTSQDLPSSKTASPKESQEIAFDEPSGSSQEPFQERWAEPSLEPSLEPTSLEDSHEPSQENSQEDNSVKQGGWTEPPAIETLLPPSIPASPIKTGGFRGRPSTRGRGGRGRGGRPPKNVSGRATPVPIPANGIVKSGRGGARGRAKKMGSGYLKDVSDRKDLLKHQYRSLVSILKPSLTKISEDSLSRIMTDPQYHRTLPEYDVVMEGLDEKREKVLNQLDARAAFELEAAERMYKAKKECEAEIFSNKIAAIDRKFGTRILDQMTYVYAQAAFNSPLDEIPFSKGEHGRIIKHIKDLSDKTVHPFGTARFKEPILAKTLESVQGNPHYQQDPKFYPTIGDTEIEQHPANHYLALTEEGKRAFHESEKKALASMKKEKNRKKVLQRDILFAKHPEDEDDDELLNDEDLAAEEAREAIAKPSSPDDEDYPHDPAPEQAEDEHGVSVPRKRGRGKAAAPNNRIITPAWVDFDDPDPDLENDDNEEDWDIGLRNHYFKLVNGETVEVGRDASANPRNFYVPQVASNHNAAKNKPGDLDENIVRQYKLHPRFGLGINGSVNPDQDDPKNPTFLPKKSKGKHPSDDYPHTTYIHEDREGNRSISYSCKLQAYRCALRENNQLMKKVKFRQKLVAHGMFQDSRDPPEAVNEPEGEIASELMKAVDNAVIDLANEPVPASPITIVSSPRTITPQRTGHYDPVRNSYSNGTVYQSIYGPQPGKKQSQPSTSQTSVSLPSVSQPSASRPSASQPSSQPAALLGEGIDLLLEAGRIKEGEEKVMFSSERRNEPLPPAPQAFGSPYSHFPQAIQGPSSLQAVMNGPMPHPMMSSLPSSMMYSGQGMMGAPRAMPAMPTMMHTNPGHQLQSYAMPYYPHHNGLPPPPPPPFYQGPPPPMGQQPPMQHQSPRQGQAPATGGGLRELRPAVAKGKSRASPQKPATDTGKAPPTVWNSYGAPPPPPAGSR